MRESEVIERMQKRKKRRRKPSRFAYMLMLFTVALCAAVMSAAVFLNVDSIKVSGNSAYNAQQIIDASGIKKGDNLLRINKTSISNKISTKLPFVESAKIKLRLPSTIEIAVNADNPVYMIKYTGGFIYADRSFKVLEVSPNSNKDKGLVLINGAQVKDAQAGKALTFADKSQQNEIEDFISALKSVKLDKISGVDISNSYELAAQYDSRIRIVIGTPIDIKSKLEIAAAIINSKLQSSDKGTLDVSTDNKRYTFNPD